MCVLCFSPSKSFQLFYDRDGKLTRCQLTHYLYGTMLLELLKHTLRRIYSQIHLLKYSIWGYFLHMYQCTIIIKRDEFHYIYFQYIIFIEHLHPISFSCSHYLNFCQALSSSQQPHLLLSHILQSEIIVSGIYVLLQIITLTFYVYKNLLCLLLIQ